MQQRVYESKRLAEDYLSVWLLAKKITRRLLNVQAGKSQKQLMAEIHKCVMDASPSDSFDFNKVISNH